MTLKEPVHPSCGEATSAACSVAAMPKQSESGGRRSSLLSRTKAATNEGLGGGGDVNDDEVGGVDCILFERARRQLPARSVTHPDYDVLHNMMELVVVVVMMRLAALTVSCVSALVAHGRPAQAPCGAIDPNGRPTVANGRPAQTPCGAHSTHSLVVGRLGRWRGRRCRPQT